MYPVEERQMEQTRNQVNPNQGRKIKMIKKIDQGPVRNNHHHGH